MKPFIESPRPAAGHPAAPVVSQPQPPGPEPVIPARTLLTPQAPAPVPVVASSSTTSVSIVPPSENLPVTTSPLPTAPLGARAAPPSPPAFTVAPVAIRTKATSEQKLKKILDIEELLGRNWLPKIGIFLLVMGLVRLLAMFWPNIPVLGKDALLLFAGGGLLGLGV